MPRRRLGEHRRAGASALEAVVDLGRPRTPLEREAADAIELPARIAGEGVDGDDGVQTELLGDPQVAVEIVRAPFEVAVAVMLEGTHRRDQHDGARRQAADAGDDVEELLQAEIGCEAALGHDDVRELQRHPRGDERAVAVRDVRERPGMDECRLPLERLDEIRADRVLQQDHHRPGDAQLLGRDRLALVGRADGDPPQPRT